MNRVKDIVYDLIGLLAALSLSRKKGKKKLLIVRVDEIGDYILWRPFLQEIAGAVRFKEYEIHFCGNNSWQSLFNLLEAGFVSETHWLHKARFKTDMRYRYSFLRNIRREEYDIVINPTFSRDKRNDDAIVKASAATRKIGMKSNLESVRRHEQGYDKSLYSELFDYPHQPIFEFERNKLFTVFVTGESRVTSTHVPSSLVPPLSVPLPEKYIVIFPGSRSIKRIWPTEYFITVCNFLFEAYGFVVVVAGAANDIHYTKPFCDAYKYPVVDLYGQTTLPDMLSLLKNAACLLSVDTGSVHLAAAVGCPVFGIFNGSQYKRFAPYPASIAVDFHAIYPDVIEQELKDEKLVQEKYEFVVPVPYASVLPGKVIAAMKLFFKSH